MLKYGLISGGSKSEEILFSPSDFALLNSPDPSATDSLHTLCEYNNSGISKAGASSPGCFYVVLGILNRKLHQHSG